MLARYAADSFDWHQWGKDKNTRRGPSAQQETQRTTHVNTPDPEPFTQTVPSQPFGGASGYSPPSGHLQHAQAPYAHPGAMSYSQQYHHAFQGPQPAGFPPTLSQYPQVPRYPYSPSPYGMYGAPAGQPVYNSYASQQPHYGMYPPQVPQLSSQFPGPANFPVRTAHGQNPLGPQHISARSEGAERHFQVPSGHPDTQPLEAPPSTPVPTYGALNATHNEVRLISERDPIQSDDVQRPRQVSHKRLVTQTPTDTSEKASTVPKQTTQKSRPALKPDKQVLKESKRPREASEKLAQGSRRGESSLARQRNKKPRRENVPQATPERRPRTASSSHALKRSFRTFEDDDDESETPPTKKLRRDTASQTRIVKLRVKSTAGVQRLREVLGGTSQANSQSGCTTQASTPSRPRTSASQSSFSSQASKKTRLDEILQDAGVQSVPGPPPQIRDLKQTRPLSTKPDAVDYGGISKDRSLQRPHTSDQERDNEAEEAAMILLNMRLGR